MSTNLFFDSFSEKKMERLFTSLSPDKLDELVQLVVEYVKEDSVFPSPDECARNLEELERFIRRMAAPGINIGELSGNEAAHLADVLSGPEEIEERVDWNPESEEGLSPVSLDALLSYAKRKNLINLTNFICRLDLDENQHAFLTVEQIKAIHAEIKNMNLHDVTADSDLQNDIRTDFIGPISRALSDKRALAVYLG